MLKGVPEDLSLAQVTHADCLCLLMNKRFLAACLAAGWRVRRVHWLREHAGSRWHYILQHPMEVKICHIWVASCRLQCLLRSKLMSLALQPGDLAKKEEKKDVKDKGGKESKDEKEDDGTRVVKALSTVDASPVYAYTLCSL
jgi:hypothetical protein